MIDGVARDPSIAWGRWGCLARLGRDVVLGPSASRLTARHDHPRRMGADRQARRRLDPRLRRLSRAEGQGAGGHRDPRDLRPDRLGADRRGPAGRRRLRRHRARPALLPLRHHARRPRQRPQAHRPARARKRSTPTSMPPTPTQQPAGGAEGPDRHHRLLLGRGAEFPLRDRQSASSRRRWSATAPLPIDATMPGIRARVLGVYGEDDARINAALPDVERQMQAAGARFRYGIYPGTGHGFLKPGRKGSDGPAGGAGVGRISGVLRRGAGEVGD